MKRIQTGKEEVKLFISVDDMMLYIKKILKKKKEKKKRKS